MTESNQEDSGNTFTPDSEKENSHCNEEETASAQPVIQKTIKTPLQSLRSGLLLPRSWSDQSSSEGSNILLCKISRLSNNIFPLKITHCLIIYRGH